MPKFKVRVGDICLSRLIPWNELLDIKDEVKRFATWNPDTKEWVIQPHKIIYARDEVIETLKNIFGNIAEIEEIVDRMVKEGRSIDVEIKYDKLIINPPPLSREDWESLINETSVPYYVPTSEFDYRLIRLRLLKYNKQEKVLEGPPVVLDMLENWANKRGFSINIIGELPEPKQIYIPKDEIQLLPFQKKALEAWLIRERGTIVIPTGGGKTFVGLKALSELAVRTLICVTTIELAKQWKERIRDYLGIEAGLLGGGQLSLAPVTVAIYNSATKYVDRLIRNFDFIIFDEGHHVPAETFKEIALKMWARKRMVLSATPERYDKNELLIYATCGDPVYKISYYELARMGLVAPIQFKRIYIDLTSEEWDEYRNALAKYREGKLAYLQRAKQIALTASKKYEVLARIIQKHQKEKILVFCQYINQAEKAYRIVRNFEPRTALVTGSVSNGDRRRIFDMFRNGNVRIIVTTTVLDEGIDVPDADVAIIMSGSGTKRQMIQRVGRVVRWRPGKIAKIYEIVASDTIDETLAYRRDIRKDFSMREMNVLIKAARYAMLNSTIRKLFKMFLLWKEGKVKFSDEDLHELVKLIEESIKRMEMRVRT